MSHARGQVRFDDGTIMYYEYNGTCDVVCSCLYDTATEMQDKWRNQPHNECKCGKTEPVQIATNYGDGSSWIGKACKNCRSIDYGRGNMYDEEDEYRDGLPSWWM